MNVTGPPNPGDYAAFYETYVGKAKTNDLLSGLESAWDSLLAMIAPLGLAMHSYRYAPEKWSLKEILIHLMDAERVFAYRALCLARRETQSLPGFDENLYARYMKADSRIMADILEEYELIRRSTIHLLRHLDEDSLDYRGAVNQHPCTARALGYIILGHQIHHQQVFEARYLGRGTVEP
ncbi:MAG: DinB family protein [Haliscomenobacter sp.]|nr:DinB family protein [Haliscomenobacter sp.]MBK7477326.1 DinB family protein [Haliscomenobacter sp.]MBK8880056.1 DinB family protein [Haliscomenobacter sp.]